MKLNTEDLDRFIKAAQELKRTNASYERKSARAHGADSVTYRKTQADMHWEAMHVERCWDTLHARAVDLGLCDARPAEDYEPREVRWTNTHGHIYRPEMPRCVALKATGESSHG